MSRIGKKPIVIPSGVTATVSNGSIMLTGPKGELTQVIHPHVTVVVAADTIMVTVADPEEKTDRALWGLFGALINSMLVGVTKGYSKQLEVNGVGFKVALQGSDLVLSLGFSHQVHFPVPAGITATVEKNVITLVGIDKQLLGETAARLRRLKKPEPYKGKGIKYMEEVLRRKAGKTATK